MDITRKLRQIGRMRVRFPGFAHLAVIVGIQNQHLLIAGRVPRPAHQSILIKSAFCLPELAPALN
ncbi:MAG: hypothetical protein LH613_18535 [Chamaesiphon sp.]|nr:hypothetical protein [Chamaesiphon sp.]